MPSTPPVTRNENESAAAAVVIHTAAVSPPPHDSFRPCSAAVRARPVPHGGAGGRAGVHVRGRRRRVRHDSTGGAGCQVSRVHRHGRVRRQRVEAGEHHRRAQTSGSGSPAPARSLPPLPLLPPPHRQPRQPRRLTPPTPLSPRPPPPPPPPQFKPDSYNILTKNCNHFSVSGR